MIEDGAQFDLASFLRACLHDAEDADNLIHTTYEKLLDGEITKFEHLMLLSTTDLAELGLSTPVAERLGMLIQIFKGLILNLTHHYPSSSYPIFLGDNQTEMEQLHFTLSKMVDNRMAHQITPEHWQQCEEGARLFSFASHILQW